ncbi:endo-1,4-beta-xylanase [Pseudoduganella lurida]|uniref:Beta-xylanase n=1 Tax=Pseudoduganella lurida TaxID=1036180 RepID=A0A562REB7_9BURK|nr:endo-1,4-beta-xylanase [Pseudoduganella lurida]TWI67427.1 endo-1,4-beta-xylanase [Pseudoduganella lurida]
MTTRRDSLQLLGTAASALLAPAAFAAAAQSKEAQNKQAPNKNAPPYSEPLKDIAVRKGLRFGNAIGIRNDKSGRTHFNDPRQRALMARECGVLVAENEMKWQATQPRPGAHDFAAADRLVAWAKENRMLVRGHTLVWQEAKWLPDWVNQHDFGTQPAREAERLMTEHIAAVCGHFGRDIYSYDVVNEAVDPPTGTLRRNVLNGKLGAVEQIDVAFRLARQHAPHAQLVYNDFMGPAADNARHRDGVLRLLEALQKAGTPIGALGLQSHIGSWGATAAASARRKGLDDWRRFLDEVTAMDLDLLITEFDVSDRTLPADITTRDATVAAVARDFLDLTLSYPRCRDFLTWGLSDDVSWLQTWAEAKRPDGLPSRPCPYDAQLRPKPLRDAIAAALRGMPQRTA